MGEGARSRSHCQRACRTGVTTDATLENTFRYKIHCCFKWSHWKINQPIKQWSNRYWLSPMCIGTSVQPHWASWRGRQGTWTPTPRVSDFTFVKCDSIRDLLMARNRASIQAVSSRETLYWQVTPGSWGNWRSEIEIHFQESWDPTGKLSVTESALTLFPGTAWGNSLLGSLRPSVSAVQLPLLVRSFLSPSSLLVASSWPIMVTRTQFFLLTFEQ